MSKPRRKSIPAFASEAEERAFWEAPGNDSTEYLDWSKAQTSIFPNLKPSTTLVSLPLPDTLLARIQTQANKLDVPYQSLMKVWLAEKLSEIEHTP